MCTGSAGKRRVRAGNRWERSGSGTHGKPTGCLRRLGTPAEVARAALWLALDNSDMIGKVLPINAGIEPGRVSLA